MQIYLILRERERGRGYDRSDLWKIQMFTLQTTRSFTVRHTSPCVSQKKKKHTTESSQSMQGEIKGGFTGRFSTNAILTFNFLWSNMIDIAEVNKCTQLILGSSLSSSRIKIKTYSRWMGCLRVLLSGVTSPTTADIDNCNTSRCLSWIIWCLCWMSPFSMLWFLH